MVVREWKNGIVCPMENVPTLWSFYADLILSNNQHMQCRCWIFLLIRFSCWVQSFIFISKPLNYRVRDFSVGGGDFPIPPIFLSFCAVGTANFKLILMCTLFTSCSQPKEFCTLNWDKNIKLEQIKNWSNKSGSLEIVWYRSSKSSLIWGATETSWSLKKKLLFFRDHYSKKDRRWDRDILLKRRICGS